MPVTKELTAVQPQPGKPLYLVAKERIREAIDGGMFAPGEQMPSTKELSDQLEISLVTAHRALQELVNIGVLRRSQGKGTFVHQAYLEGKRTVSQCRLALVFHPEASLADFQHSQILEGIRQAAQAQDVDLVLLRFEEDVRKECNGFLFVNPLPEEVEALSDGKRKPHTLLAGARTETAGISWIDVDNTEIAREAVAHLVGNGHSDIAYVGAADETAASTERFNGFRQTMIDKSLVIRDQSVVKGSGWRLDERERNALVRLLSSSQRPTAVFASGYYFALDVYAAAQTAGLKIGDDLSVVGVDDPPSAKFLSPPLTTLRQPLMQLGHNAVTALVEACRNSSVEATRKLLRPELVIRRSTGARR